MDDESEPAKAPENANKLVQRDKVDVLVGTVHSGVQMGMVKVANETGTLLIIPNAGLDAATGALCAPNMFRTSFSNWQPTYPMGKVMAERGNKKRRSRSPGNTPPAKRPSQGFKEGFTKAGGKIVKELWLPFPNVEFQALLTEIASHQARRGVRVLRRRRRRQVHQGLRRRRPQDKNPAVRLRLPHRRHAGRGGRRGARGCRRRCTTAMDSTPSATASSAPPTPKLTRPSPTSTRCRATTRRYCSPRGLDAVKGDISKKKEMVTAMEKAKIDSPRGKWTLSKAHNPIQDIYLRKVVGHENKVMAVAHKALADPARGCKM